MIRTANTMYSLGRDMIATDLDVPHSESIRLIGYRLFNEGKNLRALVNLIYGDHPELWQKRKTRSVDNDKTRQ